jgi:ABC-type multidrug transport system fused ATPase/permease subunit
MDPSKAKTHPIDRTTWFTRLNLFWTFEEMAKSSKGSFEQRSHFQLPKEDRVREAKAVFEAKYKDTKSLMRTVGAVFACDIFKLLFLATLVNLLTQAGPYVLGEVVALLSDHGDEIKANQEYRYRLYAYFGFLAVSLLVVGTLNNYVEFTSNRLGFRIACSVNLMIFDKIQRINVLNKTEHSTGNILNYVQIDSGKFQTGLARVINSISCILSLIFGITILYLKIGDLSFIVLGVFSFGCIVLILLYNLLLRIIDNLMQAKDRRVLVLTNIISNVKYIKLRAWENFFQYKMSGVRGLELKYLFHLMLFNCADIFIGWMNFSLCQIAFVVSITFLRPDSINVPTVSAALGVLSILFNAIQMLPWYVGLLLGVAISLKRITSFLDAEELDFGLVQRDPKVLDTYGMLLENGDFSWLPPPKDMTQELNKKSKLRNDSVNLTLNDSLLC